jgi:16S rRNA G966 N2-methylase RsmD
VRREHAQEFTEALDMIGAGWYRQAVLAGQMGVPEALGLSWVQWVERYMPKLKLVMRDRQAVIAELAEQEIDGKTLSNRQIAAVLGIEESTVRLDRGTKKQRPADKSAEAVPSTSTEAEVDDLCADKSALTPDSSERAERITRDNRAEQKRADRADQEAAVIDVPAPEIRPGRLGTALADVQAVDLVFTDPPYPREHLPVWTDLGVWAAGALKPGALLVAYSGQYHLPEVMQRLGAHLTYQWLGWIATTGPQVAVHQRPIMSGGKPLLIFSNGSLQEPFRSRRIFDVATSTSRTRELHTWEQNEAPAAYYIDALTRRGELVVDPFVGSGTFALVAKRLGRRFVGCDIDPQAVSTAQERLAA